MLASQKIKQVRKDKIYLFKNACVELNMVKIKICEECYLEFGTNLNGSKQCLSVQSLQLLTGQLE